MKIFFLLMLLSFNLQANDCRETPEITAKVQSIKDLIAGYQPQIEARYGQKANLIFLTSNECQSVQATGGHDRQGNLVIKINPGIIHQLSSDALTFAICHELGHIMGEVTPKQTKVKTHFDKRDSIEGEADYFGGACTRNALCSAEDTLCERAVDAGREALLSIHGPQTIIDPDLAQHKMYQEHKGINPDYPDVHCRMLSIIYGVIGEARPTCWYNPKVKKKK